MSRTEYLVLGIIVVSLTLVLGFYKCLTWVEGHTDNVYVAELIDNIASRGLPLSQVHASVEQAVSLWAMPAEQTCALPLKLPERREFNYFRWHPYVILYPIAPLAWFIPGQYVISSLIALSFVGLLGATYWLLRIRQVSPGLALLFCALVMAHPGWYQSFQGQVYPDRLFLLPAMLFIIGIFTKKTPLFIGALLASLIVTERTGIICATFLIGAAILYPIRLKALRWHLLGLGFFCALYSTALIKFYIQYYATANFSGYFLPATIKANLNNPVFVEGLGTFFIINLLFLGIFALFEWKGLLLLLAVMIPNIFGSVGGAEKTGWLTHYHTMYFPFLIWAAAEGYAKLYRWCGEAGLHAIVGRGALAAVTLGLALTLASTAPTASYKQLKFFAWTNFGDQPLIRASREIPAFLGENPTRPWHRAYIPLIKKNIRQGSMVATVEAFMPALYKWSYLTYYPDGLAEADYALVVIERDAQGATIYGGQVCYLGPSEYAKQSSCLTERLRLAGYDLNNPVIIANSSFALLKRNKQSGN